MMRGGVLLARPPRRTVSGSGEPFVTKLKQAQVAVGVLIAVMSLLFALAMFRGLEAHSGYEGNAYQVLHPESFPNDPMMSPWRPTTWSLLYLVVRLVGELWLDDRFTIVVFAGITAVTLIGLDRMVRLLGARQVGERAAMLSLMVLGHQILGNGGALVNHFEFAPATFAGPVNIWLLYASLAGSPPRLTLPLLLLSPLVAVKPAAMPLLIALILFWRDRLGPRGKRVTAAMACAMVVLSLVVYYAFIRPPDASHARLFDFFLQRDEDEANPFQSPLVHNLLFGALCLGGLVVRGLEPSVLARVRIIAGLGLAVWLLGGLYFSYAPDALKIPYLEAFNVSRMLWWTQYVLYVAIGVTLLKKLQRSASGMGLFASWVLLMALYFIHTEFHVKLALVVGAVTVGMLWFHRQSQGWNLLQLSPAQRLRTVAMAMCVGTLSLYTVGTVHHRVDDLRYLLHHGIIGNNIGAKWVGINEYIRENTPSSATFLALSMHKTERTRLVFDWSLRSRTGRSMHFGHPLGVGFDYRKIQWFQRQAAVLELLLQAWERRDVTEVAQQLSAWGAPDYLVVPTAKAEWLRTHPQFAYVLETVIGDFTILRKRLVSDPT